MVTLLDHKSYLLSIETLRHWMVFLLASMSAVCLGFVREAETTENTHALCMLWLEIIGSSSCDYRD